MHESIVCLKSPIMDDNGFQIGVSASLHPSDERGSSRDLPRAVGGVGKAVDGN